MIYAIYRAYYGSDWLKYAIRSTINQVDKVIVFVPNHPWSNVTMVKSGDVDIQVPPYPPDGVDKLLASIRHPKLHILECDHPTQQGQSSTHVQRAQEIFGPCEYVMIPQADHVEYDDIVSGAVSLMEGGVQVVSTRPVDVWKYPHLRLPQRNGRICTTFWNLAQLGGKMPHGDTADCLKQGHVEWCGHTFNMHYASHPHTMWWRYMLRTAQASLIIDDPTRPGWYDDVWLKWQVGDVVDHLGWCQGEPQLGQPYPIELPPPRVLEGIINESKEWAEHGI